ncbi:MAG TPA: cupin domain-containing protein [Pyrinomonadaceae bacterium]|nr:cupin domain-containing protein [Pyrinomonadaceae bacterium]
MNREVANGLSRLLEPHTAEEFLASSWGQTYRHIPGRRGKFAHLLPWDRLNDILRQHRLDFPRLRLMREGRALPVNSYLRHTTAARNKQPIPRLQPVKFTGQLRAGATLVLDAVDELHEPLEELAAELERLFRERIQINSYAGWHTSRGFDLHWDDHDVFILQVTGRKRWSVYGQTRPHPLAGDTDNPKPENAPLWEATLEDGDLLYIPRGWWHVAEPLEEPTLHLTVGIHKRTGLDLLTWLTGRLRESEIVRRDLPRFASPVERAAHMRRLREELLAAWDDEPLERYFDELDAMAEPRARLNLPWGATADAVPSGDGARVRLLAPRPLDFKVAGGVIEFSCHKKRWRFAAGALVVLNRLADGRACSVAELCEAAQRGEARLDEQTVRALLGELIRHGLVAVVTTD